MLVAIAGNIGAGKSSIISLLQEHYGWKPLYEPVLDNPYLPPFYDDMQKWAYHSQMYFLSRHCCGKDLYYDKKLTVIQDRSIYEDAEIFTEYLFEQKCIEERDYKTYRTFYEGLMQMLPPPKAVIYLRADTDALIQNIRNRGRDYERDLPRAYIADLNERYERWAKSFSLCPLHVVEAGNFEFQFDTQAQEEIVYSIRQLVQ